MDLQFRFRASAFQHNATEEDIEKETGMTDAECEYWDKYITNPENPVQLGPNLLKLGIKPGFAHVCSTEPHGGVEPEVRGSPLDYLPLKKLDQDVAEYLRKQAAAFHKSQTEIINDLVREKLAVGV
jgi:hypothetical protein